MYMLIKELLESVSEHGYRLAAYCIVVAELWKDAPLFDPTVAHLWAELAEHNETMLKRIMSGVNIEFTDEDPYKNIKHMMFDIIKNKRLKIFKSTEDSHPGLSPEENNFLRSIHDYLGHYLPNKKDIEKFLKDTDITDPDDKRLKSFRLKSHSFSVRGEMNTYLTHSKLLPKRLKAVLFSEIVAQISTYFVTNNYTQNKVVILDGIDFDNVGKFTDPKLEERKNHFINLLKDESVKSFDKLGTVNKSELKWSLLSFGSGKTIK